MTETPWDGLPPSQARRVNSKGRHDFFWVRMPDNAPALLLRMSDDISEVRPLPKLKHIGVFYRVVDGRNSYCITLQEKAHIDLFETLCRDVAAAAEQATEPQHALSRAVSRTLRWHHLLRSGGRRGLSLEEQRGLVAELAFLRELVQHIGPLKAVDAWKGPEDSAKDFELPGLYFEIKARRSAAHPKVRISSEAQLSDIEGARFCLRVHEVDTLLGDEGQNLADHVRSTAELFDADIGALDLWEQRLAATGYQDETVEENRRWHLGAVRTFEVGEGFPKLVPPLPPGVEEVSYAIRLDACATFERSDDLNEILRSC
ncbi:PD-(D/E)XK motif protein [Ruegeria sp. B32]|uniref:PD-(D/E)XK motif protein n=1 Tax=Ruegeria sp. B32 TaxID=2867020 RepID=UPI0021A3909A|nr:PD-(D/E)XK motif protein [Ruegeria sp. B32]UWR06535.1 PD-(D/E)XK motif protein [Ruegeria sp. B32]